MLRRIKDWISHRFGLSEIYENALDRRVPKTPWYYGDGTALLTLFAVQVTTGAALALTYTPSPDGAYESIVYITTVQTLGWFVRGMHYWAAGMMMVMLAFHLFRILLVAGYKTPREGTWIIGVLMLFVVLPLSFTGYVLRWDQHAIYAIKVSLNVLYYVPWIGNELAILVQGGPEIGSRTLSRIFSLHAIYLPLLLAALAGFHLYLVIIRGVTSPAEREQPVETPEEHEEVYTEQKESKEEGEHFFPETTTNSGLFGLVVVAIVVVLTLTLGPSLHLRGDLVSPLAPSEEWWFWWASALAALLPPRLAPTLYVLIPVTAFVALMLLPLVDRRPHRGITKRPVMTCVVIVAIGTLLYLSDLRRRSPWTGWPDPEPPPIPARFELTPEVERGRQLFAQYGCNSCHAIAGHGWKVGPDLATPSKFYTIDELRAYVLRPPEGVAMPPYEGRMTDEELDRIVEFCHVAQTFPRR